MPTLQALVNDMLDEFDRRFGAEADRSILISSTVRSHLPSHGPALPDRRDPTRSAPAASNAHDLRNEILVNAAH